MPPPLRILSPAKVNLALSVGSPVTVPGAPHPMHPIASWMMALAFGDDVLIEQAEGDAAAFDIAFADDAPAPSPVDWPLEKDLAYRAHALLRRHTGGDLPVSVTLRKRIPTGAGLGGGSSNAAAVLVGVNRLYDLALDRGKLIELSTKLGSDVAFFVDVLLGRAASAVVAGLGETVEPLPTAPAAHLALVFPRMPCPTGPVYAAFDKGERLSVDQSPPRLPDGPRVEAMTRSRCLAADAPFNDLANAALAVQPPLGKMRENLVKALEVPVHVTGSGSTLFAVGRDAAHAAALAEAASAVAGVPAVATHTADPLTLVSGGSGT